MHKLWIVLGLALAGDLAAAERGKPVRVLVTADEDPRLFSLAGRDRPGLERELIEGFARQEGLALEIVLVPTFDEVIPMLLSGRGDLITGILDTEERRRRIDFTVEVLPARHLVVTRRPHPPIQSLEDLRGARVGVVTGTSWAQAALDAGVPASRITSSPTTEDMVHGLVARDVDAVVVTVGEFIGIQERHPDVQQGLLLGRSGSAAWAVRKSDRALRAALNAYLDKVRSSPAWNQLVLRYFSPEALTLFARSRHP